MIEEIKNIAREAGKVILKVYAASEGIDYTKKDDDSPLTQADSAANKVICEGLEKLSVQYPIISEENKAIEYKTRKDFEQYWLVDPLDGTKEFIKRNGEFTVNIALVKNGCPILGVVYTPVVDKMYWAEKGKGAWLEAEGERIELKAPAFKTSDPRLGLVCSRSHLNEETKTFIDQYNEPNLVSKGSSLKFLMIAEGQAHVYPRIAPTMEWDTGAAQIVLEEAGGKVVQFETETPLAYNKENLLNPFFVAYGNIQDQ